MVEDLANLDDCRMCWPKEEGRSLEITAGAGVVSASVPGLAASEPGSGEFGRELRATQEVS